MELHSLPSDLQNPDLNTHLCVSPPIEIDLDVVPLRHADINAVCSRELSLKAFQFDDAPSVLFLMTSSQGAWETFVSFDKHLFKLLSSHPLFSLFFPSNLELLFRHQQEFVRMFLYVQRVLLCPSHVTLLGLCVMHGHVRLPLTQKSSVPLISAASFMHLIIKLATVQVIYFIHSY